MSLLEAMKNHKGKNKMVLYWDIETLTYNKLEGQEKPSKYKNVTYSVAIGWNNGGVIDVEVFDSFQSFYLAFFKYAERYDTISKSKTSIEMIAHNCNKYDNHFLLHDNLLLFDDIHRENLYMKNAIDNENTMNMKEAKLESKEGNIILEKRVKSSINLDLIMYLKGWRFQITDNFMKTTTSLDTLGKKLKDGGFLTDDDLKTDFDYTVFDVDYDMTEYQAHAYAKQCFETLDKDQMKYIINDIVILGQSHIHYSEIFPNFDYSAMTFSVNILNSYLNNDFTKFQLLNLNGKEKISYTDYQFHDMNLYDYLKKFYRGGLNMYNQKYLAKIIDEPCFSIDLNSSYPYVMYHEKIPTYLVDYGEYVETTKINTNLDDKNYFTLFKCDKTYFNEHVLIKIRSNVLKQMLVKYYNNDDLFVNINSNTLRLIQDLTGLDMSKIGVVSYLTFECEYFGARDIIFQNYYIKTQGKLKNKIDMKSPYAYTITDEINETVYSQEEILLSKTILNGLYGIPALRSHFNLFRLNENGELKNEINGYKNTERNILFSTFVTSQALYNLLEPLKYLTQKEIDEHFIYCDTDSLYLKRTIYNKLPSDLFDPISLGKWDIENDLIEKMYVLNHKKYAYVSNNEIHVASAGIPQDAFNLNQSFDEFIDNDFHDGAIIYNNKSIYNEQGTISIYPSKTYIDKGNPYPIQFYKWLDEKKRQMFERIRNDLDHSQVDDVMYIESDLGAFSLSDLYPVNHFDKSNSSINSLKMYHYMVKNNI